MEKPLVYVCMPYRSTASGGVRENIRSAVEASVTLQEMGFYPLCPHLLGEGWPDHLISGNDKFWLAFTMEVMRRCDVVFCGEGWRTSRGCLSEVQEALDLKIPTVRSFDEAVGFLSGWERRSEPPKWGRRTS